MISNIAEIDRLNIPLPPKDALIVFVSPVHGFNYPPVMLNFISRFPKGRNKVLLMNTRAGILINKYNLPGLSGATFYLASLILMIKGYSIKGMVPVDLPSNWLFLHPSLSDRAIRILHEKNKKRVVTSAEKVISGKRDFRAFREILQDIIISPVTLGYYFAGRFFFSKTFYASKSCNNCDICIKGCPVKAIIKIDERPFWTFKCESCMKCMVNCPERAIETGHGFVFCFFLLSSIITGLFFKYFDPFFSIIDNRFLNFVAETLLSLFFLGIFYKLIHYLMRFKFIEKIMVYTSLTKYKFWGKRYKALKNF